jgi:hypothetical protein
MHMTVEGGLYGWEMGMDLLVPWVSLVEIKNFRWNSLNVTRKAKCNFAHSTCRLPMGRLISCGLYSDFVKSNMTASFLRIVNTKVNPVFASLIVRSCWIN